MKLNLFPEPKVCDLTDAPAVVCAFAIHTQCKEFNEAAQVFSTYFQKLYGTALTNAQGGIELIYNGTIRSDGYTIDTVDGVKLYASSAEGIRYALASMLQILSFKKGIFTVPSVHIEDYPDKDFRSLMLDLARQFHPAKTVFQYIDLCFLYKIKYLHLHLIDDQLYTLPSKAFPKMPTEGKSYSFEEIRAFNDYAKARGVILIPEFEAPGHAASLNLAYPELFGNKLEKVGATLITENGDAITEDSIICAGSETSMQAMENMIDEICELFPDAPYIHIGGDEANIDAWNDCTVCKQYMRDNGIEDVEELYSDFIARISRMVLAHGRTPIVWEGFPVKGAERIPRETIVIAWESHYHLPKDLLDEGFRIINAAWQPLYIVASLVRRWYAKDILQWNVYNWQHWWSESAATFNPINVTPTENVLGAEICAWGCTFEQEIGLVMENLAALTERTWNVKRRSDLNEMLENMEQLLLLASRLIA